MLWYGIRLISKIFTESTAAKLGRYHTKIINTLAYYAIEPTTTTKKFDNSDCRYDNYKIIRKHGNKEET